MNQSDNVRALRPETVGSNLIVSVGYGDHAKLFPRSPRLAFEEIAPFA
jgi:hypothetical protein